MKPLLHKVKSINLAKAALTLFALAVSPGCTSGAPGDGSDIRSNAADAADITTFAYVVAAGGLRLRATPSTEGAVIRTLEQWTRIELHNSDRPQNQGQWETIDGRPGSWVRFEDGWLFSGYLATASKPYYARSPAGIPVYTSPSVAAGSDWSLPSALPVLAISERIENPEGAPDRWIEILKPEVSTSIYARTESLRTGNPRAAICTTEQSRNCLATGLQRFVFGGRVSDSEGCVADWGLYLFPEGEVLACGVQVGSWFVERGGAIGIRIQKTRVPCLSPAEGAPLVTFPSRLEIREVRLDALRSPRGAESYPQWREVIRKGSLHGYDHGHLPLLPNGEPYAVWAPQC